MADEERSIELEIEVEGTPEEVWRAIATGPGISSWYVPHIVEERTGGSAVASFGPGPEMQINARVAAWEPPNRILFDKGADAERGLAFEWLVEAIDGGSCVVRLVNSGFNSGDPWDDQYDAMTEGWKLFMRNLQLHLKYFEGQSATASLPMAMWPGTFDEIWSALMNDLGLPASMSVGDHVRVAAGGAPPLAGTVVDALPGRVFLIVDDPAPGTALIAVEGAGVSIWSYLYGEEGAVAARRDEPLWFAWLADHAPSI